MKRALLKGFKNIFQLTVLCSLVLIPALGFSLSTDETAAHSQFTALASGAYTNQTTNLPLLVETTNSGRSWKYPSSIFRNLQHLVDPNFFSGVLLGASCTGTNANKLCIASGNYCTASFVCLPLIAVSTHNLPAWKYPKAVFHNLQTTIDPALTSGFLSGASCIDSGSEKICLAAGFYDTASNSLPLVAVSTLSGKAWFYPRSIFENLTSSIDPNFVNGFLFNPSCTRSDKHTLCIAAGWFCTDNACNKEFPLVAVSRNDGKDWVYPQPVFQNISRFIDPKLVSAILNSASCTATGSKNLCAAAGSYFTATTTFPLVAVSRDEGRMWFYPHSIFKNLREALGDNFVSGSFNAVTCKETGELSLCIAAGNFKTKSAELPLLAISTNGGRTWTYPTEIFHNLKKKIDRNFVNGFFNATSCTSQGTCIASGAYCTDLDCINQVPLLAVKKKGETTWTYPSEIFHNLTTTIDPAFVSGSFSSASCKDGEERNLCVASGFYATEVTSFPLLALSTTNGASWSYPPTIYQNLKASIAPDFESGSFGSAATTGDVQQGSFGLKRQYPQWLKHQPWNLRQGF